MYICNDLVCPAVDSDDEESVQSEVRVKILPMCIEKSCLQIEYRMIHLAAGHSNI